MKYLFLIISLFFYSNLKAQAGTIGDLLVFGGSGSDELYATTVDSQGYIYNTGVFHNTVDFDPGSDTYELTSAGNDDIFIQKLDADGQLIWAKQLGSGDSDAGVYIQTDNNNNVYITGWFSGTIDFDTGTTVGELTSSGLWDVFVLKLDSDGNYIWAKRLGNSNLDFASALVLDSENNVYLSGMFKDSIDLDPSDTTYNFTSNGGWDLFIVKLDSNGDFVWGQNLGGTSYDKARHITVDSNDNVYVTGQFKETVDFDFSSNINELTAIDDYDAFVLKLDSSGNFLWVKQFGGSNKEDAVAASVDAQQNIYVAGKYLENLEADQGGGITVLNTGNNYNSYVIKLDENGNFQWVRTISGTEMNMIFHINIVHDKVFAGGFFYGDAQISWDSGFVNMTSAGDRDAMLICYNTDGDFIDKLNYGSAGEENIYRIARYDLGIYIAGSFEETVDFDPLNTGISATSNGDKDACLLKINTESNAINQFSNISKISIYPNPAHEYFYVELKENQDVRISIYDVSGKKIKEERFINQNRIPVKLLHDNPYLLIEITGNHYKEIYKLLHY